MSSGLLTQIEAYYTGVDDAQDPIRPEEVAARLDSVRTLPATPLTPAPRRPAIWVAAASAAVVLLLLGALPLLLGRTDDTSPATEPSETTVPATTTTPPAPTTPEAGPDVAPSVVSTELPGMGTWTWQRAELPSAGSITYVDGLLYGAETGIASWVEAGQPEDLRGVNTRAWLLTSPDAVAWTQQQLPTEFEGRSLYLTTNDEGALWILAQPWVEDSDDPQWYTTTDGTTWEPGSGPQPSTSLAVSGITADNLEFAVQPGAEAREGDRVVIPARLTIGFTGAQNLDDALWSAAEAVGSSRSREFETRVQSFNDLLTVELVTGGNGTVLAEVIWSARDGSIEAELIGWDDGEAITIRTGRITLPPGLEAAAMLSPDDPVPEADVMWLSDDGGATFDLVVDGPTAEGRFAPPPEVIARDDRFLAYVGGDQVRTTEQISESTTVTSELPVTSIWESSDGSQWRQIGEVTGVFAPCCGQLTDQADSDLLLLATEELLWRSTDGVTWEEAPFPDFVPDYSIRRHGQLWFAVHNGENRGPLLLVSEDTETWHVADAGLTAGVGSWVDFVGDRVLLYLTDNQNELPETWVGHLVR